VATKQGGTEIEDMKTKLIVSLIIGITSVALSPMTWAGGHGGGGGGGFHGGGGGFHGGGGGFHGGSGFHGGGFGGGRAFGGGARSGGPSRSFGGSRAPMSVSRSSGFRASGVSGMHHTGTNIPNMARQRSQQSAIASRTRTTVPPTASRVASNQRPAGVVSRQQSSGVVSRQRPAGVTQGQQGIARQNGPRGFTGHVAERHEGAWHGDWDHRHSHFDNGRFFVYDSGFWWGLDSGYFPWDYYPYYTYDYYPYDYVVGGSDTVPSQYQGSGNTPPASDPTVSNIQTQLTQLGYYNGSIDGLFGPTTRDALARYQTDKHLSVTGSLSPDTLQSFGLPQQASAN